MSLNTLEVKCSQHSLPATQSYTAEIDFGTALLALPVSLIDWQVIFSGIQLAASATRTQSLGKAAMCDRGTQVRQREDAGWKYFTFS